MKHVILSIIILLSFCSQARAQEPDFDFNKYRAAMQDCAYPRYAKSSADVRFIAYALIDVDGDGKSEVWVRSDEGQDWQGVFALVGDNGVELLADADVCSELSFYKNAVGFQSYISPGRVDEAFSVVKDSRIVTLGIKHYEFNIFSEEQETLDEYYFLDDKAVDEETYDQAFNALGDKIEVSPVWHDVLPSVEEIDDDKR